MNETVLIMDFGGQYTQLIARRVRDLKVFTEIKPYTISAKEILAAGYKGIIFTGGPNSVYLDDAPRCDKELFNLGIPVLGICYGAQLMASQLGGNVKSPDTKEYGHINFTTTGNSLLFKDIPETSVCWMSHTDYIEQIPTGFEVTATTNTCPTAAMECLDRNLFAVQFHPEVEHTEYGNALLTNFLFGACKCKGDWEMSSFAQETIQQLKIDIGDKKVLCGLSGGVDSAVAALMVHKAVGDQLTCIFVDHGLLRKNEGDEVEELFKGKFGINMIRVDAKDRFLGRLAGVSDPETKRKIIGEEFIRVFEAEARKLGQMDLLCQGTIYPDVVESGVGHAAVIKSHHNVGGLPDDIGFTGLVEPLRTLFKDEVRRTGLEVGLPEFLVWRQPFPGPGLAVRIIGDITPEKILIVQEADAIFREEIALAKLERSMNQYFAVLTGIKSVGVMGDGRTYDNTIALRSVTTNDFMTADWTRIPYDVLAKVSSRIVNEVTGVNRIVYDITSKPPSTIEWE